MSQTSGLQITSLEITTESCLLDQSRQARVRISCGDNAFLVLDSNLFPEEALTAQCSGARGSSLQTSDKNGITTCLMGGGDRVMVRLSSEYYLIAFHLQGTNLRYFEQLARLRSWCLAECTDASERFQTSASYGLKIAVKAIVS